MRRRDFLVATAGLAAACSRPGERPSISADTGVATPPRTAPSTLVLVDAGGPGGFGRYLAEMLGADGVLDVAVVSPGTESPAVVSTAAGIVVYGRTLTPAWAEGLDQAVRGGAVLVAVAPGPLLLERFGIRDKGPIGAEGVRLTDRDDASPLRLHVEGRRWTVAGPASETVASFVGGAADGERPAAVRRTHGRGRLTAWAFDVARNVACIRQGNPEWTSGNRDAFAPQQLIDAMTGWVRPETLQRPDADLFQQALSAALASGTLAAGPQPLVDYFPGDARSVLVATADAHAVSATVIDALLRRVEGLGGRLSVFYMPNVASGWRRYARAARRTAGRLPVIGARLGGGDPPPSVAEVAAWRARGHEFAPHPDIDDESVDLDARFERAWDVFAGEGYGARHVSTRTHRILWSGWARTAHAQRRLGVRMNLDAYNYGPALQASDGRWAHGHLIGSGLPMRFANEDGSVVDCYQQPTQIVDEALVREFGGPENLSAEQAVEVVEALVADAIRVSPAALCGQFHADGFLGDPARVRAAEVLLDGSLAACRKAGVPVWTAARWLAFVDGRRSISFSGRTWAPDSGRLAGTVTVSATADPGVALLLPADVDGAPLTDATLDGSAAALTTTVRGGRTWARCVLRPGATAIVATYRR